MSAPDKDLNAWIADYLKPKARPVPKALAVVAPPIPAAEVVNEPEVKRSPNDLRGLHVRELTWEQAMALQTRAK
jgi:hypothetical protein